MKLFSGAALGALGASGAGAAERVADRSPRINEELGGATEWVVQLEDPDPDAAGSRDAFKQEILTAQIEPVRELVGMDGVTILEQFWITNAILVAVDEGADDPEGRLSQLSGAQEVHPNFEVAPPEPVETEDVTPLQDHRPSTYGLNQVNAPSAWEEFGTRGEGARVAVLDTGVDPEHPDIDLAEGGWAQFDRRGREVDSEPFDNDGHGTHVSGTAVGGDASGLNIGVAPDAELYHAKVLNNGGSFAQIIAGIQWAVENEADIINMSLGGPGFAPSFIAPIRNARSMGTFVVAASGNSDAGSAESPGAIYETVAVGATTSTEAVAGFSTGQQVYTPGDWGGDAPDDWPTFYTIPDISAPGNRVLSSVPGGGYARFSGTSMASPHAAGVAALVVSAAGDISVNRLERILERESVHPQGEAIDPRYGDGIVDAFRSLARLNADGEISGTVTGPGGEPIQGLEVSTSYGTTAVTDDDGEFRVPVQSGEVDIQVGGFGVAASATVTVEGRTTQDLSVSPVVDVAPISGQRPDIAAAPVTQEGTYASTTVELQVANLEEYAVSLGSGSADLTADDVTLEVAGQTLQPGDSLSFSEPVNGSVGVTIDVADDVTDGAILELDHEFRGPGSSIPVTTGPTTILQDPAVPNFSIQSPNFDSEVGAERLLTFAPTIENTGDLTETQDVILGLGIETLSGEPLTNTFPVPTRLGPGESTQLQFPISFRGFTFPRQTGTQFVATDDDQVEGSFRYLAAENRIRALRLPEEVTAGDPLTIELDIENIGELAQQQTVSFLLAGGPLTEQITLASAPVAVEPGTTATIPLEIGTDGIIAATYTLFAASEFNSGTSTAQGQLTVVEPEAPIIGGTRVTDPDNDGLYEDLDGDGELTIADVQAFFAALQNDEVQGNPSAFDFNEDGKVSIADLQALFAEAQ